MIDPQAPKKQRGFAIMDPAKRREIASKGGRAAHSAGTAHEWSPDEARAAARKGLQMRGKRIKAKPVRFDLITPPTTPGGEISPTTEGESEDGNRDDAVVPAA